MKYRKTKLTYTYRNPYSYVGLGVISFRFIGAENTLKLRTNFTTNQLPLD